MAYKNPEVKKAKAHEYYLKNKERLCAKQKKYHEEHKDEDKAYHQRYYLTNKEELNAQNIKNYEAHREERMTKMREYYQKNKAQILAQNKEWANTHPEETREIKRRWELENTLLHRKIWEDYFRVTIPDGFVIHHKDCNPNNNDPHNLLCLPPSEHTKLHWIIKREAEGRP